MKKKKKKANNNKNPKRTEGTKEISFKKESWGKTKSMQEYAWWNENIRRRELEESYWMEERDRWKADREREKNNREDRDSVYNRHRSRSLTDLAILNSDSSVPLLPWLSLWVTVGCLYLVPITDCSALAWRWDSRLWSLRPPQLPIYPSNPPIHTSTT